MHHVPVEQATGAAAPVLYGPPPGTYAYAVTGPPVVVPVAVERRLVGTRLKSEGWCCVFALALLFWPAMCIPCCLPQCQEDVYEDVYVMARFCVFSTGARTRCEPPLTRRVRVLCVCLARAADAGDGAAGAGLPRAAPAAVNEP